MGNGVIENLFDVVLVDRDHFDRSKSRDVAREVSYFNSKLTSENRHYLLLGVGRWGSLDPWLGIPVRWDQIAGARVIIETNFQNLNSFMVGYFTIRSEDKGSFVNWDWLNQNPSVEELKYTKLIRFKKPFIVKMNGQESSGIILKPEKDSE